MISTGIDFRAVKFLSAANIETIFEFFHLGTHRAKIDATRAMRSDSFTRNSFASRMRIPSRV